MSGRQSSGSGALRARLNFPVIDSDGHWVEFGPVLLDYLKQVGGSKAVDGFKSRPTENWHLTVPLQERRDTRPERTGRWGAPTSKHTRPAAPLPPHRTL